MTATSSVPDERPALLPIDGRPCLKFDGINDHLAIPASPSLSFQESESFTLEVRVHVAALPAKRRWQGVVTKSLGEGTWYGLWIDDRNWWVFGAATNLHGSPAKTGTSVVVGVQEGGRERRLYVNGSRVATGPAMPGSGAGPLWIGGGNGRPEFFDGRIQELRIWRRALDPAEIRALSK
jgi:hypothetical protein